jgi:hypothetical protein
MKAFALAAAAVLVPASAASARRPNASEQVVFSKSGAFSPSLAPVGWRYAIRLMSSSDNGASVDCTLTNSPPPTSGPTNSISVSCTEPTTGTAAGSVVVVTRP